MMKILRKMLFKILFGPEKDFGLVLENLALRQQVAAMKLKIWGRGLNRRSGRGSDRKRRLKPVKDRE